MDFIKLANLFEKLEKKSKRLEKIMILRDFLNIHGKTAFFLFDLISGNFQREINKKNLGISIKTIFSVLSFVSKKNEREIETLFNKSGDIGLIALEILEKGKQDSLFKSSLTIEKIKNSLKEISTISGNNSNKKKKEILSNLFLSAETSLEYKYLARILIDDLRIGVSFGVLKEASVNYFFPKIIGIHNYCSNCNYFTLNSNICFKCQKKIDINNFEELFKSNSIKELNQYKLIEITTPKEIIGLDNFIGKVDKDEKLKSILRISKKNTIIKTENPREIYNLFLSLFEKKYNIINNFQFIFNELNQDLNSILSCNIILGKPIKSMLGSRVANIDEAFEVSDRPALIDFKYDGLRVQIHNNFGKVNLFSRNLDDITSQFPEVVKYIKDNYSDLSFVIDSECVGFDYNSNKFLDFQILSKRIMTKNFGDVSHINVVVKFFDLMYLNGETLLDEEYYLRREKIEKLLLNRDLKQKLNFDIKLLNKFKYNFEY